MAESHKPEVKAQKRFERRSTIRQSLFTSEYLKCKYPHIFKEAATMYNEINTRYPKKPDLRKCLEFKQWKNSVAIEQGQETVAIRTRKPYIYRRASYSNIMLNPDSRTAPEKCQQKTMQLNIELMPLPRGNNHHETVVEESSPPSTPEEHPGRPSTPEEHPGRPEQPLPEPLQEPLQEPLPEPLEDNVDPFRPIDEIPPQIIDKILSELRLDPQLSAIMDDVQTEIQEQVVDIPVVHAEYPIQEQNLEVDIPELEVDIPELNLITDQDDIFW